MKYRLDVDSNKYIRLGTTDKCPANMRFFAVDGNETSGMCDCDYYQCSRPSLYSPQTKQCHFAWSQVGSWIFDHANVQIHKTHRKFLIPVLPFVGTLQKGRVVLFWRSIETSLWGARLLSRPWNGASDIRNRLIIILVQESKRWRMLRSWISRILPKWGWIPVDWTRWADSRVSEYGRVRPTWTARAAALLSRKSEDISWPLLRAVRAFQGSRERPLMVLSYFLQRVFPIIIKMSLLNKIFIVTDPLSSPRLIWKLFK